MGLVKEGVIGDGKKVTFLLTYLLENRMAAYFWKKKSFMRTILYNFDAEDNTAGLKFTCQKEQSDAH